MFDALNINTDFQDKYRHLTKYKKIIVLAKIDGTNWYDISDYALEFRVLNRIEVVNSPAVDSAVLKVKNVNNCFTPTQYNDVFDPSQGKFNGTVEDDYLNKVWEVKVYVEVYACDFYRYGIALLENTYAYWRCSLVDLVNGIYPEGYTPDGSENKILIPLFWGWKPQEAIKEQHKTAQIELKDLLWIATQKKPDNPLLYAGYTPDEILNDIFVNRLGFDSGYLDLQELTTTWEVFIADNNKSWWQIIQEIVIATGGKITCSPDGKIKFRTRIENYSDPSVVLTINEENIKNYNLDKKRQYNKIKVQSEGYEIGTSQEFVVDHELEGDARTIQAGQQATFEFEYTSEYIKNPDNGVYLSYSYASTPIATDEFFTEGQDDGNIRLDELIAYPDKLVLKITNLASSTDYTITHVKFKAIPIKKKEEINVEKPNQTNEPDSEYSITSFYSEESLLSNIADVFYSETTKTIRFELQLNEFYPDLYAGNLVNLELTPKGIASGTFIVEKVEHNLEKIKYQTKLTLLEWKDITFNISDKTVQKKVISDYIQQPANETTIDEIQQEVSEIQNQVDDVDNRTNYIDGAEPSIPSGLNLATINENGISFITASWDANTETDLLGYELAWSYDGIDWNYITTANTLVKFEVAGNMTVYVKVRAYDAEGKKSNWSSVESITSAKDEVPPAKPVLIDNISLYASAIVKLQEPTEPDFSHFLVEIDGASYRADTTSIRIEMNPGETKTIHIKAVDFSGNESQSLSVDVSSKTLSEAEQSFADVQDDIQQINNDISEIETTLSLEPDDTAQYYAIKQNANEISTVVAKLSGNPDDPDQYSAIKQNANNIDTIVATLGKSPDDATQYSAIKQNAQSISTIVTTLNGNPDDTNQYSAIKQNAQEISTVVADVDSIDSDLGNLVNAANRWSSFQQLVDEINLRVVAKDENENIVATELSIQNGKIVVDANQFQIFGDAVVDGTLYGNKIAAKTVTVDKLSALPSFSLPEGAIAYFTNSLIDDVNGIVPEGYKEINLAPGTIITPYNVPENSVVGDLLIGNKIYAGHEIQVGNSVFIKNVDNGGNEEGKIIVKDGTTEIVKIGEKVATKFVDKIEMVVNVASGIGEPDVHIYASLDNSNWIDLGGTFDLNGNRIQINLFNYVAYGQTVYLKAETTEYGAENGDIDVYVDDVLFDTYHYDVDTDTNPSQVFTITLPDEKNDGIEINGGVINSPIINVTTESGELRLIDSGWGINDGGSSQDGETITRSINFENIHTNGLIIFRSITSGNTSHAIIRIDTTNETKFEIDTFHDDEDSIYSASLNFYSMEVFNCALEFRNKVVKVIGDGIAVPTSPYPPSNPEDGQIYYNSSEQKFYGYAGSRGWIALG